MAKDLVLVIDTSDSMALNNRITIAKEAGNTVLNTLNPNDRVSKEKSKEKVIVICRDARNRLLKGLQASVCSITLDITHFFPFLCCSLLVYVSSVLDKQFSVFYVL